MDAGTAALIGAIATGVVSLTGVILNAWQSRSKDKSAQPDLANVRLGEALDRVSKQARDYADRSEQDAKRIDALEKQVEEMRTEIVSLKDENRSLRRQISDGMMGNA